MIERKPFSLHDLQTACLSGQAEVYLDPHHYAEARALVPPKQRIRDPERPGAHFVTAHCVVIPTETFH